MGSDYAMVRAELDRGTPGAALCATCPWHRPCVNPPAMTSAAVQKAISEAAGEAEQFGGVTGKASTTILASMVYGGRDLAGEMCPVFIDRLAGPDGRDLAEAVRTFMRGPV